MVKEGNQLHNCENFFFPFYYGSGSGSAKVKSYGSQGFSSGSATQLKGFFSLRIVLLHPPPLRFNCVG
jgi:hypothetical protein